MAGHERRAVLAVQYLPQPGDVRRERRLRELRCGDVVGAKSARGDVMKYVAAPKPLVRSLAANRRGNNLRRRD
jgi:hypothetical protein